MLQDGRIIAVGDLSAEKPDNVATGYRISRTRSIHPRWDHYVFSSPGNRMEFRLYGLSDDNSVTETSAPNRVPAAWRSYHDYDLGTTKFNPSVLVSGDGVVFVNERCASGLDAWETVDRMKIIVPKIYGKFLTRQSDGWFYAVQGLSNPPEGKVARFRTELPANANVIDYMHAWGGATFFVSGRLDALSLTLGASSPGNSVSMGSGDTSPAGILKSARLIVTKNGRLAVEHKLYMGMNTEGRLDELSEFARAMHQRLVSELEELYG